MKIDNVPVQIRMNTKWVNYNCGVRMVGRVCLQSKGEQDRAWKDGVDYGHMAIAQPILRERKVELIKEFIAFISNNAPPLHGDEGFKNPVFPSDSGCYVPTAILVADAVSKTISGDPWYGWAPLVKELSDNPTYEVEVIGGPFFQNAVMSSLSRVWQLTLPKFRGMLLKNSPDKWSWSKITAMGLEGKIAKQDWEDLKSQFGPRTTPQAAAA